MIASRVDDPLGDRGRDLEGDEGADEVEDRRPSRPRFRGESARVETLVAIELAVSWKPFVKSKNSATTTTATRVTVIGGGYAFLTTMFAITLAAVSQASSPRSSAS